MGYVVYCGGTSGGYSYSTNVSNQTSARMYGLQAGQTYFFAVTSRDSLGLESLPSSEISYQVPVSALPTVALTSPLNGASYTSPANINLAANVAANGHTITKVQFYNGATLLGEDAVYPYSYAWNGATAGNHSLIARVVYDAGSTLDSAPANVAVTNPAPTITLTSPIAGSSFQSPATIGLAASVTANGNTISKVQFFNGATLLGEDAASPYSYTWGSVSAGNYSVKARVIYGSGSNVDSAASNVTISEPVDPGTVTFSNSASIAIADAGAGTPYPAVINVAGLGGTISKLTVTLNNLSHTYPGDIDMLLVGPDGQNVMIFSDAGADYDMNNATVTLSDSAAPTLPVSAQIVSGTFKPSDLETGDLLAAPAPVGPYATALSAFNGQSANGTWSLYVHDDGPGDQGAIAGGWSLAITTTGPTDTAPTISDIAAQSTVANTPTAAIPFTINDAETPASNLSLTASSSNPTLVPNANIVFGGSGSNRTVTVTPINGSSGSATITVTVTDGNSNAASDSFVLTVTNLPPPTIALTSPFSGASYTAPASMNLAASVTANGHTITKVQFYNGATLLGEDISSPYSFSWANVVAGNYSLSARVVYDAGSTLNSASANVTVTNLLLPPLIVLTSPATGASYSAPANCNLAASVTANGHTITKVQFYNGATLLGEDISSPYSFSWANVGAGSYSLTALAVYDSGSTVSSLPASVSVSNPPPVVVLTSPSSGANYTAPAAINLTAGVTANGHIITKVQFYNGATLLGESASAPYILTWTNVGIGTYTMTARAFYDSGSAVDSSSVNVAVTLLSPPWQTANIGNVALTGNAYESNGVFTVQGSGNIANKADTFRFVYQPLSGDGDITARINSISTDGANRCVGVMIRESLSPNSKYAFMGINQNRKFRWQRRSSTAGNTSASTSSLCTPPSAWTRLVRSNNTLYGYSSTNGVNWTRLNSASITMAPNIYVGFVVASGSTNVLNTSVFSNVSATP